MFLTSTRLTFIPPAHNQGVVSRNDTDKFFNGQFGFYVNLELFLENGGPLFRNRIADRIFIPLTSSTKENKKRQKS